MKHIKIIFVGIVVLIAQYTQATLLVSGDGTSPDTFKEAVTSKVFDRATGTLYVGLATPAVADIALVIAKTGRFINTTPKFQTIAQNFISAPGIAFLALASQDGVPAPILGVVPTNFNNSVFAVTTDGAIVAPAETAPLALLDAGPLANLNGPGNTAGPIAALAANAGYIFAAVSANGSASTRDFGDPNSGIAVVNIDLALTYTHPLSGLTQTAAVSGDSGIKAQRVDGTGMPGTPTVPQIFIQDAVTNGIGLPIALYWDDPLQRLYIGVSLTSGTLPGDGARSVVVAHMNNPGTLDFVNAVPNSGITPATSANQQEIVAGIHTDIAPADFSLTVSFLRVMHTSTGPSYLIVQGGNGLPNTTGNLLYALPLVDTRDDDGEITNVLTHGTLAKKDAPLVNFKFVTPATAPGDLVKNPVATGTDLFALVGGTVLPIPEGQWISDLVVVDDAVYLSINAPQNNTTESGILYSQAKFDEDGAIFGWTPWSKRAFPFEGLPSGMNPERIKFFDVDAVSGNIWAIGGDDAGQVAVTQWDRGANENSLAFQLNQVLSNGSFSVLDLDAFTRGFDGETGSRYALFGGAGKVVFALISQSVAGTTAQAPQTVILDFSEPENFLTTQLPLQAGCVNVLEYSRIDANPPTTANFFFAGTQTGLYVFAGPGGNGLDVATFGNLDIAPFSTAQWIKAPNITGAVVDVKTLGNVLYVLTYTTSRSVPLQSTLYRIPFQATVNTMFAPGNIFTIAQTAVGIFDAVQLFTGMQLIGTLDDSSTEQLVLATNQGLFRSSTAGGLQGATNQTTAAWVLINPDDRAFYNGIAGVDPSVVIVTTPAAYTTGSPTTVWPVSIRDQKGLKTFEAGTVQQLNGTQDAGPFNFVPANFNGSANFPTIPLTKYFFSDGARRFFIIKQPQDAPSVNRLMIAPFNDLQWQVSNPAQNIINNPTLAAVQALYWVKEIGMSGAVLAGTNNGVVALE